MDNIAEDLQPLAVDIDSVKEDPQNARKHPAENMEALCRSLQTYGQRKPVVVNSETGVIEAGNALWAAAKQQGWDMIAVIRVKDDPDSATGYAVMDNRSAELSEWDYMNLDTILRQLDEAFDINLTGYTEEELQYLLETVFIPEEEPEFGEDIPTFNKCPRCGYEY
jgi:ParB-like chromosome segregation protein Spo0J